MRELRSFASYLPTTRKTRTGYFVAQDSSGKLYFAGEATDEDWYATTVGAWRSGETVAKEIMKTL